jgi:hypothetical protein
MLRLAASGARAEAEASRMVTEKILAVVLMIFYLRRKEQGFAVAAERAIPGPLQADNGEQLTPGGYQARTPPV